MSNANSLANLANYWLLLALLLACLWAAPPAQVRAPALPAAAPAAQGMQDLMGLTEQERAQLRLVEHLAQNWQIDWLDARHIVENTYHYAAMYQLSPTLLLAVMAQESSFRTDAVSSAGAVGLMQVMPRWHDERRRALGHDKPLTDPVTNIAVGAHVLNEYLERARGNLHRALHRYSGGTQQYASRVLRYQREFERVVSEAQQSL
jgi:soluble lytic murein transglycosylase-like protein